jgi:shikimate kinase
MLEPVVNKPFTSATQPAPENERITFNSTQPSELQELRSSQHSPGDNFLEEAERLTLLAKMGVDLETLEKIEERIEKMESKAELSDSERDELESLLDQRAELFREANERQNGEQLPPGSMLSVIA